eukprot:6470630-Amphidinium_carterae.1
MAVGLGLGEDQWRVPVCDILRFLQSERVGTLAMTEQMKLNATTAARMAMRNGVLHEDYWPTEPHLAAFAQARSCVVRVWSAGQKPGHEWLLYGDEGQCITLSYNGVDHYDALVASTDERFVCHERPKQDFARGKDHRKHQEGSFNKHDGVKTWCIVTLNVTSWQQAMGYFDYLHSGEAGYDPDVVCMQEHRTEGRSGECTVTNWLQRQGYRVAYQGARKSEQTGRLSGGVLIA